jgi:hypothetical protein
MTKTPLIRQDLRQNHSIFSAQPSPPPRQVYRQKEGRPGVGSLARTMGGANVPHATAPPAMPPFEAAYFPQPRGILMLRVRTQRTYAAPAHGETSGERAEETGKQLEHSDRRVSMTRTPCTTNPNEVLASSHCPETIAENSIQRSSTCRERVVAPSPKCLQHLGGIQKPEEDSRRQRGRRNPLEFEPLAPEVVRHHHVRKTLSSEFESLPPSQPSLGLRRASARLAEAASRISKPY